MIYFRFTFEFCQDVTGRCLTAEVGILSDILFLRAGDKPPSYVLWSVLVGVSISRGDWDTAVDVLIKMEGDENSILLKNRYAKDQRGDSKPSKKMYKGAEVSQAVELGVLYAIDGGLPLLTRGGGDALQALNLDRLIPKESSSPTGEESTTNINKNEENKEGEVVAAKSQKVHNLLGISHSLNQIPKKLLLETASKRTVCTMGDILGFLERCRGSDGDQNEGGDGTISEGTSNTRSSGLGNGANFLDESSSSYDEYSTYDDYDTYVPARKEPIKKARVPVGVALLQSLFAAAINERKYKQAARIIRLLEGSRLVIDLDAPALVAVPPIIAAKDEFNAFITASVSASDATDTAEKNKIRKILGRASDSPSDASAVKVVRETLARKWAALLIGSSLNKLKNNVAGSVKMMAALKYLQKEQTDELN